MSSSISCPCGSLKTFAQCCEPYINMAVEPPTPETLMRSRYSAYVVNNYEYIQATYSNSNRTNLSVTDIQKAAENTKWLRLTVLSAFDMGNEGEVEFIAHYKVNNDFYQMHEHSFFVLEQNSWRYVKGDMQHKSGKIKVSRNQECICGSGLKLKRCCMLV